MARGAESSTHISWGRCRSAERIIDQLSHAACKCLYYICLRFLSLVGTWHYPPNKTLIHIQVSYFSILSPSSSTNPTVLRIIILFIQLNTFVIFYLVKTFIPFILKEISDIFRLNSCIYCCHSVCSLVLCIFFTFAFFWINLSLFMISFVGLWNRYTLFQR